MCIIRIVLYYVLIQAVLSAAPIQGDVTVTDKLPETEPAIGWNQEDDVAGVIKYVWCGTL